VPHSPGPIPISATAALDARAEHALFDTIRELRQGRTVLRIFTPLLDRAVSGQDVLKGGTVVESGTHGELMALRQPYAELYSLRASTTLNASVQAPD